MDDYLKWTAEGVRASSTCGQVRNPRRKGQVFVRSIPLGSHAFLHVLTSGQAQQRPAKIHMTLGLKCIVNHNRFEEHLTAVT